MYKSNANNNHWLNYQFRHTNVSFLIIKRLKIKMRNILFLVIVSFEVSNLSEIGSSSFQRTYSFGITGELKGVLGIN